LRLLSCRTRGPAPLKLVGVVWPPQSPGGSPLPAGAIRTPLFQFHAPLTSRVPRFAHSCVRSRRPLHRQCCRNGGSGDRRSLSSHIHTLHPFTPRPPRPPTPSDFPPAGATPFLASETLASSLACAASRSCAGPNVSLATGRRSPLRWPTVPPHPHRQPLAAPCARPDARTARPPRTRKTRPLKRRVAWFPSIAGRAHPRSIAAPADPGLRSRLRDR
jgi:hypothetical protein